MAIDALTERINSLALRQGSMFEKRFAFCQLRNINETRVIVQSKRSSEGIKTYMYFPRE